MKLRTVNVSGNATLENLSTPSALRRRSALIRLASHGECADGGGAEVDPDGDGPPGPLDIGGRDAAGGGGGGGN